MEKSIFRDMENQNTWFILGCQGREEARKVVLKEFPDQLFNNHNRLVEVQMRKCLDCGSYWVSDDICGECGEDRLSKRVLKAFEFSFI